jgi:hypothetical protein
VEKFRGGTALSDSRMRAGVYDEAIGLNGQNLGLNVVLGLPRCL